MSRLAPWWRCIILWVGWVWYMAVYFNNTDGLYSILTAYILMEVFLEFARVGRVEIGP